MKYKNAKELFPDELLLEIQKYSSGELVYIPKSEEKQSWGEASGARQFYKERNEKIRLQYHSGEKSLEALCDEYGLSPESLKRILYK